MKLVQVVNTDFGTATGGGGSRTIALDRFVDSMGGRRIIVQDRAWAGGAIARQMRLLSLLREIEEALRPSTGSGCLGPDVLVLRYPGFPFFWSIDRDLELARGMFFLGRLKRLARRMGFRVIVDILDLLRYPSPNPELSLRLNDRLLGAFESSLFGSVDELWACSEAIGRHLAETYDLPRERVRVVLNGNFRPLPSATAPSIREAEGLTFFYAGDLAPGWRGTEIMLDGFTRGVRSQSARLVLCGVGGEWVADAYPDSRIVNLGSLPAEDVAEAGRSCHVGLVPQPEHGYYHLAFPTKVGLYLTLGLPVLTTRAREAAEFVERSGVGAVADAACFGEHMNDLVAHPHRLEPWRRAARVLSEDFYWDSIYGRAFCGFLARSAPERQEVAA